MSPRRAVAVVALVAFATQGCASVAPSTSNSQAEQPPPTRVEVKTEGAAAPPSQSSPPGQAPPAAGAQSSSPPALSVGPAGTPPPAREVPPSPTSTMSPPLAPPALPGAPPAGAPVPGPPPAARRFVVFNFDNADVEVVVQAASEIAGFSYVIAPAARGKKVTVQTQGRIASDEVLGVLLTILDVNGLAAVRTGNLYRIIPREGAPQTPVRTIVGRELPDGISADEIVSQVVPLQYVGAAEMAALLRPFVPAQGGLAPHPQTNLLIITDTASNVRRLLDIVKLTDVQVAQEEIQIILLKHADAQEMAQLLTQLFATGRLRTATVGAPGAPPPIPAAPGAPVAPRAQAAPAAVGDAGGAEQPPLIVAERRSNALIVHARKQEMGTIRRLIGEIDIDLYGGQRVFIHFAENTKARDLASTLDAIYGKGTGPAVTGTQPGVGGAGVSTTGTGRTGSLYGSQPTTAIGTAATTGRTAGAAGRAAALAGEEGLGAAGEVRFIADEVTNAVIVTTYPRSWKEIEETIRKLDKMPRQVLVEVLAAEVTLTDDMRLGIEWAIRSGRFDLTLTEPTGSVGILPARPPRNLIPLGGEVGVAPGLNLFTFAADKFLAALNALAVENKVNVLSNPSIMTTENKKAVINVSRSVPILTGQQVPIGGTTVGDGNQSIVGTQTVEYRDAGIILTVTPRIGEQGTVALDVKQEVNDVGSPVPPTNSPEFQKREAETSVVLLNNQTLVLGGLIQTRRTWVKSGIPFLNRIPVLGYVFGSTEEKIEKTELLLLITPRVVGTAIEAGRLTEEMRRITPGIEESVRRAPRPPSGRP